MDGYTRDYWRTICASLLTLTFLNACQKAPTNTTENVRLQTVTTQQLTPENHYLRKQTYTGKVRFSHTAGVGFELAGKINQLLVDTGDTVTQGQLLATLDTRLLDAEHLEILASLAQNQADLDLAKSTLKRNQKLKKQGYVSAQQLDENQGLLNSLAAAKNRLLASKHANQLKRDNATLLAPFSGRISKRQHNLGEVVDAGSTIFTLIGQESPEAYVGIPAAQAARFQLGNKVNLQINQQPLTGTIMGISAETSSVTHTVELRISLPNNTHAINGEIISLLDLQTIEQSGYWVPITAITDGVRGRWKLYTVQTQNQQTLIEQRDIDVLYTTDEMAYVQGAIQAQDTYVIHGLHKLVTGQAVQTSPTAPRL